MHRSRAGALAGIGLVLTALATGCGASQDHAGTLMSAAAGSAPPRTVVLTPTPARTVVISLTPTPARRVTSALTSPAVAVELATPTSAAGAGTATPTSAVSNCDPSYPGTCLRDGIGDYDCSGGTGNGPNYVTGPIKVLPPDPFGLDSNHDGVGCTSR